MTKQKIINKILTEFSEYYWGKADDPNYNEFIAELITLNGKLQELDDKEFLKSEFNQYHEES